MSRRVWVSCVLENNQSAFNFFKYDTHIHKARIVVSNAYSVRTSANRPDTRSMGPCTLKLSESVELEPVLEHAPWFRRNEDRICNYWAREISSKSASDDAETFENKIALNFSLLETVYFKDTHKPWFGRKEFAFCELEKCHMSCKRRNLLFLISMCMKMVVNLNVTFFSFVIYFTFILKTSFF